MSFLSFSYALFLLLLVPAYWLQPPRRRKGLLLAASVFFYALAYPPHLLLIGALALAVYLLGTRTAPGRGRGAFLLGVGLCVLALGYFKYARLLVQTLADLGGPLLRAPDLRVPLGISFFTFEFIHYLVDKQKGRIRSEPAPGLLDFSLFALFFPTLLSGPIKRYQLFVPTEQRFPAALVAEGLCRIVVGLFKKGVVADAMSALALRLQTPDVVTVPGLWMATYAYAIKIYFDFAGYSDLAIGAALLFGYRVPENFDSPYLRRNLSEFWRHWHISLSSWIRDYLFIPLGGSRVPRPRAALNLLLVMALCGLWHGAAWNFVAWGLWHGAGLGVLRLWPRPLPRLLATFLTFQYVCLGWVLFAAPSLSAALLALGKMFGVRS